MKTARVALLTALIIGVASDHVGRVSAQKAVPPDQQAYQSAWLRADPQQQIDALTKVAADYPSSRYAQRARMGVLRLLVKISPSRTPDIARQVELMLKREKASDPLYDDVATVLVDAGVLLDKAQDLSEQTVKAFKEEEFIATLKRQYAEAKMPPMDDARLERTYKTVRAGLLGTLGRIYLEQGKMERARRTFTEAERNHPTSVAAAGLGAIALKVGQDDAAYDYFLRARLTGVLEPEEERAFEAMFASRHGGDREHLALTLDEAYRTLFRNPIRVEPHQPGSASSGRAVLLEVFTGAGCPPCAGADLAVDAVRERYTAGQVIVLMHHVHIPRPDPMTNPDTVGRSTFYAVQGAPTFVVDGSNKQTGGSLREDASRSYDRLTAMIEDALKEPSHARIALNATLEGRTVKVHADASAIEGPVDDLRLWTALVEQELRYGGENGIRFHPMVVRALADFPVDPSRAANGVTTEFDVDRIQTGLKQYLDEYEKRNDRFGPVTFVEKMSIVDPANLGVVAFVQSEKDHRVLQSAFITVGATRSSR